MLYYSSRIKFFDFDHTLDHKIEFFIDPRSGLPTTEILFPALKGYRDIQDDARLSQFILASASPGHLRSHYILPTMLKITTFTGSYIPSLTSLVVRFVGSDVALADALCAVLACAKSLRVLKLDLPFDLSFPLFEQMSRCPLSWCKLSLTSATAFTDPRVADVVFPDLRSLSIASPDFSILIGSLNATIPALRVLELQRWSVSSSFHWLSDQEVSLFARTVASRCSPRHLQVLRLTFSDRSSSSARSLKYSPRIPADALRTLFHFCCLIRFRIEIGRSWDLDRAFIADLVQAFPRLEDLLLEPYPPTSASPCRVVPQDLELFATHSRTLTTLGIELDLSPGAIDALVLPEKLLPQISVETNGTSSLRFLRLGSVMPPVRTKSRLYILTYLSSMFPKLKSVEAILCSTNNEPWHQITECIPFEIGLRGGRTAAATTMVTH